MNTSKVLLISTDTKIESWLVPMQEAGIEVKSDDTQDVLAAIQNAAPALLILDVSGERLDAVSLVRRIRHEPEWRGLPIILFDCQADDRERIAGLDAGADDFLTGAISIRELIARIRAILRRGSRI